ncbi:MAG: NAD-dependent epimerase/dehydratase family protein [Pseudomonadota bacterium]
MKILITGGAGFIGSSLALYLKQKYPQGKVVAFDNLKRRGSEINLEKFRKVGVQFVHGDIRSPSDLNSLTDAWDVFLECSAEASVLSGVTSSPAYVLETNLNGTINCLETARKSAGLFLFLSTSRVYSIAPLRNLKLTEGQTRFELQSNQAVSGVSPKGISENFPINTSRSFYGTSKLASEYLIQEYVNSYGLRATINRCGVITGPGQFGTSDQGVYSLWVAHHFLNRPLKYMGFGGMGKQVRDLLHIEDLIQLVEKQIESSYQHRGESFNVGGGEEHSVSLAEYTMLCEGVTGKSIAIKRESESSAVDIPWFITDAEKARAEFNWLPQKSKQNIVTDIKEWLKKNEGLVEALWQS